MLRTSYFCAFTGIHSAAVMENGDMWTWGYGEDGALGHPKPYRPGFRDFSEKENRPRPTMIEAERFGGGERFFLSVRARILKRSASTFGHAIV